MKNLFIDLLLRAGCLTTIISMIVVFVVLPYHLLPRELGILYLMFLFFIVVLSFLVGMDE